MKNINNEYQKPIKAYCTCVKLSNKDSSQEDDSTTVIIFVYGEAMFLTNSDVPRQLNSMAKCILGEDAFTSHKFKPSMLKAFLIDSELYYVIEANRKYFDDNKYVSSEFKTAKIEITKCSDDKTAFACKVVKFLEK